MGEGSTFKRTVRWWFVKFQEGNFDLNDEEGRGRAIITNTEDLKEIVESNPKQSQRDMAKELGVSQQNVCNHLKLLGKTKKGQWIPHKLTEYQAKYRLDM
uniref:HTH_Tnp_IS630 domain-containing protein n=1 Tax=Strongyloides papillosus TaxID=174720 RepID=A0A0N5BQJ2_STREA